jgi:hypothetical protein
VKEKKTNTLRNYETIVSSLEEALNLANKWLRKGRFDLFRGQGRNWNLLASIHRGKNQKQYELDFERLKLLYSFMKSNAVLKEYIHNIDHFSAIAQHYGLNTNFIDFTTDPRIAAFFATHSSANRVDELACIICVQRKHFTEVIDFAKPVIDRYLVNGHRPEFLSLDVKNLWRLQAQKGHFLYTPFAGIETIYRFHRILFPYSRPLEELKADDIYPGEKSVLETHLDHFFSAEHQSNNMKQIIDLFGEKIVHRLPEGSIFDYIEAKCRPHHSWRQKYTFPWYQNIEEHWDDIGKKRCLQISLSYSKIRNLEDRALTVQIEQILDNHSSCRSTVARLVVKRVGIPFNKKLNSQIHKGCNLIWNGMRSLPFTNREIAIALSRFIILMYSHEFWKRNDDYKPLMGNVVYIDLSSGDGSHSRAYIGGQNILDGKRQNISKYLKDKYRLVCEDNPVALTQLINHPKYLFSFKGFRRLFVSDAIPYQTILEIYAKNPVIYFNPVHIKAFGLA